MITTYDELEQELKKYLHKEENLNKIHKAFDYADKMHEGQFRKSGEPYITHPLNVAYILASFQAGPNTIAAGLLHDVVEDTECSLDELASMFGPDVADIVDGVTKVTKMKFSSLEKQQAENHQKMILAMAKDIRVVIVKIADRLHNMRTLEFQPPEKQVRISRETLEIYAPLAHKIGMFKIKAELEDTALRYTEPVMYQTISTLVHNRVYAENDNYIDKMINDVKGKLATSGVTDYQIKGRVKNHFSIYKKMLKNEKTFEEIYDILAIRIIVDKVETCYQVLGIIHANFTPIPKRFKDYIAVPKSNMYQSLHTTVIGTDGNIFEIQIRTTEMDEVAEVGIAAHWAYKENANYSKEKEQFEIAQKLKWYAELLQLTAEDTNQGAEELVNTIKDDILDANIYVYTPKGEVISLPKGATPLDFAYKIHTDIGNRTVGAIVNNKIVPLSYELQTGDIITMRINKNSFGPNEDWLKIVKTAHAKNKIRNFLNKQNHDILVEQGQEALTRELEGKAYTTTLDDKFVQENFTKNNISTLEEMYVEIGKGTLSAKTVAAKLLGLTLDRDAALQKQIERNAKVLTTKSDTGVVVEGLKNPQIKLSNCCNPIPGDVILGYVSKGNGIAVHRKHCPNLESLNQARQLPLEWATHIDRKYPASVKITALQSNSIIGDIINIVNSYNIGIASISAVNHQNLETVVKLTVLVVNLAQLETLLVNIQKISNITGIERE